MGISVKLCLSAILVPQVEQVVNSRDLRGVSPLHIAARNCGLSVVNLLLAKRADAMAHSDDGSTVLHFAAENPDNSVLYRLLDSDICWKEVGVAFHSYGKSM